MRIAVDRRNVKRQTGFTLAPPLAWLGKTLNDWPVRAQPAMRPGIQRVDFLLQAADEIVVEAGVVILDGSHRQRGNDTDLPAKLLATFGRSRRGD
jgi:hypothetical protein